MDSVSTGERKLLLRRRRLINTLGLCLLLAVPITPAPKPVKADSQAFVTRGCHLPDCDPRGVSSGATLELNGQNYRFTGVNIYNANSNGWCNEAMGGTVLDDSLTAISSSAGGVFRAWFFQQLATTNGIRDWTAFDRTLAAARRHGFRVIVTLIDQWGDCGASTSPGYGYKSEAWYRTGYREQVDPLGTMTYRDWVADVVSRYASDPSVLAWQLVNEAEVKAADGTCAVGAAQILKDFAADVSGLIKSIERNHLVSLGTIGSGQCGAQGSEYSFVHDIDTIDLCEYHDYHSPADAMPGDAYNGLQLRINQCKALDKPLFVGETGIYPNDVGGTLAARARAFRAKFAAQFAAGVVGELAWDWDRKGSLLDNYNIGPADPVLGVISGIFNFSFVYDFAISHDGNHIAFSGIQNGVYALFEANRDGSNVVLLVADSYAHRPDFSPDDRQIVYSGSDPSRHTHGLYLVATDGGSPPVSITDPSIDETNPRFSPDGRHVVALSPDPVTNLGDEIREIDLATGVDTLLLTDPPNGGAGSVYSADGLNIIFGHPMDATASQWQIVSMPRSGGPMTQLTHFPDGLNPGNPESSPFAVNFGRILFTVYSSQSGISSIYAMSPDGTGQTPLTTSPTPFYSVHWTPEGQVAYLTSDTDPLTQAFYSTLQMPLQPLPPRAAPAAAAGDGIATVSWSAPVYDGDSPITGYTLAASPGPAHITVGPSLRTATIGGLFNGTAYTFTVAAMNAVGTSESSRASNVVTPQTGASAPVSTQQPAAAGDTVTTDPGTGPTPSLPVTTSVTLPSNSSGGIVSLTQSSVTTSSPIGFTFVDRQVQISAPPGTTLKPLVLKFALDASKTAGQTASTLQLYRTEGAGPAAQVPDCTGGAGVAAPDPCISVRTDLPGGDIQITVLTSTASVWNLALDTTPPSVAFASPADGATFKLHQAVNATFSCADQGSGIASCTAPVASGSAIDTGSVGTKTFAVLARDRAGNARTTTHSYRVIFDFAGFYSPINNVPVLNSVKAGSVVTESFSLGGNQGMGIMAAGYPKSQAISCTSLVASGSQAAMTGTLHYGSAAFGTRYYEQWTGSSSWQGTCRQIIIRLSDGTDHIAYFKFTK